MSVCARYCLRAAVLATVAIVALLWTGDSFALDWRRLHEQADNTTYGQAKAAFVRRGNAEIVYVYALTCLNAYKDDEAQDIFTRLSAQEPNESAYRWGLAEVERRKHQYARCEGLLQEVLREDPQFAPAYISLAYLRYVQLDFAGSVRLAQKVLTLGSGAVDKSNYVRAYLLAGGGKGMLAHYGGPIAKLISGTQVLPNLKKAEALQPGSAGVLYGLGSYYLLAPALVGGDREKARLYLERATAVDPLFADAYVRLAQLYGMKGDRGRYDRYMAESLGIDPENDLARDIISKRCKFICPGAKQ